VHSPVTIVLLVLAPITGWSTPARNGLVGFALGAKLLADVMTVAYFFRLVDGDLAEVSGSTALQLDPAGDLDVPVGSARPWRQGLALLRLAQRAPPT
jgi:hypothetical protein